MLRQLIRGMRSAVKINGGEYPEDVARISKPPEVLYAIGNEALLRERKLAISGPRKATPYGLACTRRFVSIAAENGVRIVCGGARGIDTCAMQAALEAGVPCTVVLAGGLDDPYPHENLYLFQRIVDGGGVIVSEQLWSRAPRPYMFRERNRIITALSNAILIPECSIPSGTFATADYAFSQDKMVLAVPGAITSEKSLGCLCLIDSGATMVYDERIFLDSLRAAELIL